MSKGPDALARIQLVTRHEQISHSALKLQSSHQNFQRAFQQLRRLRNFVVQAEHAYKAAESFALRLDAFEARTNSPPTKTNAGASKLGLIEITAIEGNHPTTSGIHDA